MRANGMCATVGRLATIGIPFAVVWLYRADGVTAVLSAVTAAMVLQAAAVALWGPETSRHGLDEADAAGQPVGAKVP